MIAAAAKLTSRVLGYQVLAALCTSVLVSLLSPRLLLLRGPVETLATRGVLLAILAGCGIGIVCTAWLLRRHRFVLRSLAVGSRSIEPFEMQELVEEPWQIMLRWLLPPVGALGVLATVFRPSLLDQASAVGLALLSATMLAAAALPLHIAIRAAFLRAIELAPPEVMREVVEQAEKSNRVSRRRTSRRLVAGLMMPVAMVAIGSALIASAHLRRADERQREETARALARAAFEPGPGVLPEAGIAEAAEVSKRFGFSVWVLDRSGSYSIARDDDGIVELRTPLDYGSARIRFASSTVAGLTLGPLLLSVFAVWTAALLATLLGRALSSDLHRATRAVRLITAGATLSEVTRIERPPRFRAVAQLEMAIERLAGRFRVFAAAQERAIEAREAATRMRGLVFASVSHDLKSPLNAILGFTALVRQSSQLTAEQAESLEVIERRGRELLALIETVLDAARVEAGQLKLVKERIAINDLLGQATQKGKDLGGRPEIDVVGELHPGVEALIVDRVQLARALATFIGHSVRTAQRSPVRWRAALASHQRVAIDVTVPSQRFSAQKLEDMLSPAQRVGSSEPRGLALALSLARAIVELHGGSVRVHDRGERGAVFCIRLPDSERRLARRLRR